MDRAELNEHMRGREIALHPGVSAPPRYSTPGKATAMPNTLVSQAAAFRPPAKFDGHTTYGDQFHAHQMPKAHEIPKAEWQPSPHKLDGDTTYRGQFGAKPLPPQQPYAAPPPTKSPHKFDGHTTYGDQFHAHQMPKGHEIPKAEWQPSPHKLDGHTSYRDSFVGWQLPSKRGNIGLETSGGRFYVLIPSDSVLPAVSSQVSRAQSRGPPPRSPSAIARPGPRPAPAMESRPRLGPRAFPPPRGRPAPGNLPPRRAPPPPQIFTTAHDDQQEVCVAVLEGDSPWSRSNNLLGQFDLLEIPPAPAGAPQIEITFRVDEAHRLHVQAKDLDTGRQAEWHRAGGSLVGRVQSLDRYAGEAVVLPVGDRGVGEEDPSRQLEFTA